MELNSVNMHLQKDATLQGGKYKIEKELGQGGFGITYLAEQTGLCRKVAIKEFFMKEHCSRENGNSFVSVPSIGSKELVDGFKKKFMKEARLIATFNSAHIIKIYDVFEENGTAYYVMEFLEGKNMAEVLKEQGTLSEKASVDYIIQVANALKEVHSKKLLHLDVKPANVMLNKNGEAILIDFGISKHYDEAGSQTSSGLVGLSDGFAPIEQYKKGGIASFSPATDIYSLGATLYKFLTGETPPHASDVFDDGLPGLPETISLSLRTAVKKAMSPSRKDRPQSIDEFLAILSQVEEKVPAEVDGITLVSPVASAVISGLDSVGSNKVSNLVDTNVDIHNGVSDESSTSLLEDEKTQIIDEQRSDGKKSGESVFNVKGVEFKMVEVEGGSFEMGLKGKWFMGSSDNPVHKVNLDNYKIAETVVTQELWLAVMGSNPSVFKGNLQRPVENVSYYDCVEFLNRLNGLAADMLPNGLKFRFPTEAEWEFAARGGNLSKGFRFSGSNNLFDVACCKNGRQTSTSPVKSKSPNELGIYDMSGNVWEWCSDWYGCRYYKSSPKSNPQGPSLGSSKVLRGGSWCSNVENCNVAYRNGSNPGLKNYFGLRLAL